MGLTTVLVGLGLVLAGLALVPLPGPGRPIVVVGALVVAFGVAVLLHDRRRPRT